MRIILIFTLLLVTGPAFCQDNEKNITISALSERIEFEKGDANNPVLVKESSQTVYTCNDFRTNIQIVDFHNDQVSIDAVDVYVSGKKDRNIPIKDEAYSSEGIFYTDQKVLYFTLPLEKKGNISEVRIRKTYKDPRYLSPYFIDQKYPVQLHEITFVIPSWVKVDIREFNFPGFRITKKSEDDKGTTTIVYTGENLPATASENSSPGITYTSPHLLMIVQQAVVNGHTISFFKNTDDLYQWYASLVVQKNDEDGSVKAKALELTKGQTNDLDKIKTIYFWVQQNIRYLAFENGIAGFRPDKANDVLRKKYGDCKGMANLTKTLLGSLGYDARLCWIGTNHIAYDYSVPSLCVDNHMICALLFKGKTYFLDATETNIGFEEYAERIQGRQVLIEDGKNYKLEHVPVTVYTQNTETDSRTVKVEGNAFKGSGVKTFSGESKESLLNRLEAVKKDKIENSLVNYINDGKKDYLVQNLTVSHAGVAEGKLSLKYDLVNQNAVSSFGNELYVDLDFEKSFSSFKIDTAKRELDFMFPYKMNDITETILEIPGGYQPENLPAAYTVQNPAFDFKLSYSRLPGKIVYRKEVNIKKVRLGKKDFNAWNKAVDGLNEFYNNQLTLTKL